MTSWLVDCNIQNFNDNHARFFDSEGSSAMSSMENFLKMIELYGGNLWVTTAEGEG
ncbi:MAG: hypothetical protein VW169_07515 [Rhodospirillaceae bacterium]|jgi:hypothetical protein